jgi:hypothetical protein
MLIEVKAIGLELREQHVKQAIDYAANQGVDWVVLTNGIIWRVYRVTFAKPIDKELVIEIDLTAVNPKNDKDVECLYLFCKEGWIKSVLGEYHEQRQALSRFFLGAVILSDPVLQVLRRELKRLSPDVKVDVDEIRSVLVSDVLKREVTEGEEAEVAKRKVARAAAKPLRVRRTGNDGLNEDQPPAMPPTAEAKAEILSSG